MKFVPKRLVETDDASRGLATRKTFLKECLSVLLFFVVAYIVLGWIGVLLATWIPNSWEKKIGEIGILSDLDESDENMARLQPVLDKLLDGEEVRDLNYRLFVFALPDPNAIAIPGGAIGVSSALLDAVESEIGLAFVLAHELGHHQERHALKAMGRMIVLYSVVAMFGDSQRILAPAVTMGESSYSRGQERAADQYALRLVHRKYGTTEGALEFFKWVVANNDEPYLQKYLGSHPLSDERIRELEELAARLEG